MFQPKTLQNSLILNNFQEFELKICLVSSLLHRNLVHRKKCASYTGTSYTEQNTGQNIQYVRNYIGTPYIGTSYCGQNVRYTEHAKSLFTLPNF